MFANVLCDNELIAKIIALALSAAFVAALLPLVGIRSRIVSVLCGLIQVVFVAAVVAAVAFDLKPAWKPEGLDDQIAPTTAALTPYVPSDLIGPHPYLALAIVMGMIGVPLLIVLDMLRHQASTVALLHRIVRQCRNQRIPPQPHDNMPR